MMDKTPEDLWWSDVSGPSVLVGKTVRALRDGRHVCLVAPATLPWRETYYARVIDLLREHEPSLLYEGAPAEAENPGLHLIRQWGLESAYRPPKPYGEFLRDRHAFSNRVVRVKTEENEATRRWLLFGREFKPTSVQGGLILLETNTPTVPTNDQPRFIQFLDYRDNVSDYDSLVFAGLLLPDDLQQIEKKKYLATLAVSLLGPDPERLAEFVKIFHVDRDDPEQWIWGDPRPDNLSCQVWIAQVQTLFPLIMQKGFEFIDRWRSQIEEAIGCANRELPYGLLNNNQTRVESPEELELGTLRFLVNKRREADWTKSMLHIPDANARERLELLWDMRNRLAHRKVCPVAEVKELLASR